MMFALIDCGMAPRLALESLDSGDVRLEKIVTLMRSCQFSITDLSRVQADEAGDLARLNMPFELGLDYGISLSGADLARKKVQLVIAEEPYVYQAALSDIAGWDIMSHGNDYSGVVRCVRRWLATRRTNVPPASHILGHYTGFQEWDLERLIADGWTFDDIRGRTILELLAAMSEWSKIGKPSTFT